MELFNKAPVVFNEVTPPQRILHEMRCTFDSEDPGPSPRLCCVCVERSRQWFVTLVTEVEGALRLCCVCVTYNTMRMCVNMCDM